MKEESAVVTTAADLPLNLKNTEEQATQVLLNLCDQLEKLPRIAIKDGQTSYKVDYDEVDAVMDKARSALNIAHKSVPAKQDLPRYFLKLHG